ncbi:D-alanyl-D-alanine carboxypeptidase [Collibacillus ludicampi]|uniref:serine-type D-Ala-D-Ala carboxypeptidase n=1 Tax=Collibacillus ludicampi TaxID=2771369 RepID=A0AAV4LEP9_9BACL|nr:D-alanyl-D-alanine carboxypeptidase family protein [Collibacillus ludicampi]GIM45912.1 D-alanyl-D-alanine carboxypeptidase [Collibacillus ludicampi]
MKKWMNKWASVFLAVVLVATVTFTSSAPQARAADDLSIDAPAAYLIDAKTGQVLYAKNENAKRYPASTTKLMTLLLVEEAIAQGKAKLTDVVPVSQEAYNIGGSSAYLDPREKWTLEDMIKFICVPSANDADVAVADYLAGNEAEFVRKMNEKAKELGMTNTHFTDASGLHNPDHYTTAHDLSIVARELVTKYPQILKYTSIPKLVVRDGKNIFENTNKLLGNYDGLDGLKTGFTDQAGYNLVSTAERNGFRVIGVILGAANDDKRVSETRKLLDYAFNNFTEKQLYKKDQPLSQMAPVEKGKDKEVPVAPNTDVYVALPAGQANAKVDQKITFDSVTAPIKKGQKVGTLSLVYNGKVLNNVDLVATQDDDKGSWIRLFFRGIFEGITKTVKGWFK